MNFFNIFAVGIILEGIISYINMIAKSELKYQCIVSIALGIVLSFAYDLDLLYIFGLESAMPYVGVILTGVLLSRGSNYIADLVKLLTNINIDAKKEF